MRRPSTFRSRVGTELFAPGVQKNLLAVIRQIADTSAANTLHLLDLQLIRLGDQSSSDNNPQQVIF